MAFRPDSEGAGPPRNSRRDFDWGARQPLPGQETALRGRSWWLIGPSSATVLEVRCGGRSGGPRPAALVGAALACLLASPGEAGARVCEVALWLEDPVLVGAIQLDLDYAQVDGSIVGTPAGPLCLGDAPNSLAGFGDHPDQRILTASLLTLAGFEGPLRLAHCFFDDQAGTATRDRFSVTVTDAGDPDGAPLPGLRVSVFLPDCGDGTTTTTTTTSSTTSTSTSTTSTTSTTLSLCGNGLVDGFEDCDDGNQEAGDGCEPDCTSDVVCGDANGSGVVQTGDALLILRAAVGQAVPCPVTACDADGDARLRTADSLLALRRAVGQSVPMACPHL